MDSTGVISGIPDLSGLSGVAILFTLGVSAGVAGANWLIKRISTKWQDIPFAIEIFGIIALAAITTKLLALGLGQDMNSDQIVDVTWKAFGTAHLFEKLGIQKAQDAYQNRKAAKSALSVDQSGTNITGG